MNKSEEMLREKVLKIVDEIKAKMVSNVATMNLLKSQKVSNNEENK